MKFKTDTDGINKPFLIDEMSTITITIEIGDVFINSNNKIKVIKNIHHNKIEFVDDKQNTLYEPSPLSMEFRLNNRYAGTIEDDDFAAYKDALSLI